MSTIVSAVATTLVTTTWNSFQPVEMAKGDVAFMTLFTVHRTGMRSNDRLRIAASWCYEDSVEPWLVDRG
jgi:hypothetical protein